MSKFRQLLLMAAQGGPRYLRALIHFVVGLTAKATTAPGSDMGAAIETVPPEVDAKPASRPVADAMLDSRAESPRVMASMVAWLVSIAKTRIQTVVRMTTNILATPAAAVKGICQMVVRTVFNGEVAPGIPGKCDVTTVVDVVTDPEATPPTPTKADTEAAPPIIGATATNGIPEQTAATMATAFPQVESAPTPGSPADTIATIQAAAIVMAKMHTWRGPTRDGAYLYIPQVYSYERVGNTIHIK